MTRVCYLFIIALLTFLPAHAAETDSISAGSDTIAASKPKNLIDKIIRYFSESNDSKRKEGLDINFIGGPHYSSETKLGLGLIAAGQYYAAPMSDTITQMSNISLKVDVTTGGFYKVGVGGNHYSRNNLWRIDYDVEFYQFLRKFWGIGFDRGVDIDHYQKFKELFIRCRADAYRYLGSHIYAGPTAVFTHAKANNVKDPALWDGQRLSVYTTSIGLSLLFDTRDNLTEPQRGVMLSIHQRFSPRFLANHYAFSTTGLSAGIFFPAWKGAVIATQFNSLFNYGNVPWNMLATFGGSDIMRGYYEGRFRDKCEMDLTVELRQRVWRRSGIVVWAGAGSVFDKPQNMQWRHILPNGGVGYRWEFKKHTNVRLDFGIGRGETSFIFNINEAF